MRCHDVYVGRMSVGQGSTLHVADKCLDVGEDVENCILRLLQAADYDVSRAE